VGTESALTVPHRGASANADRVEVAAGLADRVLHLGASDALALADDRVRVVLVEHVGGARSEPLAGPAGHRGSGPNSSISSSMRAGFSDPGSGASAVSQVASWPSASQTWSEMDSAIMR